MTETVVKSGIDVSIFQILQASIDEDAAFKEEIRTVVNEIERINRHITFVLNQCHSIAAAELESKLHECPSMFNSLQTHFATLSQKASKMPYYKYNFLYSNQLQSAAFGAVFAYWLGCDLLNYGQSIAPGSLLTIDQVASVLGVRVNVGTEDILHLTTEEYLHSLITLINEMSRFAVNSVTIGDYARPLQISQFIKDLFAAFQILNLKNDSLRRRYDSIKYDVKKVEEVVYDLSLRNLTPENASQTTVSTTQASYLKVKTLTDQARVPTRGSTHAAGYDMYASVAVEIPAGGRALVSTGISIAVPVDCYARIAPRSGLAVKNGIQTGAGVVDSDYRGEVRVLLFNMSPEPFAISVGDRIAQMVLERVYTPDVQETDNLEASVRGAGGFGSTGV